MMMMMREREKKRREKYTKGTYCHRVKLREKKEPVHPSDLPVSLSEVTLLEWIEKVKRKKNSPGS